MPKASRPEIISEQYRQPLFYVAVVLAAVVFHEPIVSFINTSIVETILCNIETTWYNDIVLYIIIIAVRMLTYNKIRIGYVPSYTMLYTWLVVAVLYSLGRIGGELFVWRWLPMAITNKIFYSDIIYVFLTSNIAMVIAFRYFKGGAAKFKYFEVSYWAIVFVIDSIAICFIFPVYMAFIFAYACLGSYVFSAYNKLRYKEKEMPEELETVVPFEQDISLGEDDSNTDNLGFKPYVTSLALKIKATKPKKAFAIGINSGWGTGKTSFMDLLEDELQDDTIAVHFNPWNSQTPSAIIQDFMETFQFALSPYHSRLSKLLRAYSNKLATINDDNTTAQYLQATVSAVFGFDTLNKLHGEINEALKEIDRKVVVYIDDLDRLDPPEILEVLKLIRNTANFKKTFFVVAYDRDYLVNAIEKHGIYNEERYLEKIFQLEIMLPVLDRYKLVRDLTELLRKKLDAPNLATWAQYREVLITDFIKNVRDVKRFYNSYSLNGYNFEGEIINEELFLLELLRLKYPTVYKALAETRPFIKGKNHFLSMNKEKIYELKERDDIFDAFDELKIDNGREEIYNLLLVLFNISADQDNKSLRNSKRFPVYFYYGLRSFELSHQEFKQAVNGNEDLKELVNNWVRQGKLNDLNDLLDFVGQYRLDTNFYRAVKIIFYIPNSLMGPYDHWDMIAKFPYEWLLGLMVENAIAIKKSGSTSILREELKAMYINEHYLSLYQREFLEYVSKVLYKRDYEVVVPYNYVLDVNDLKEIGKGLVDKYDNIGINNLLSLVFICHLEIEEYDKLDRIIRDNLDAFFVYLTQRSPSTYIQSGEFKGLIRNTELCRLFKEESLIKEYIEETKDEQSEFREIFNKILEANQSLSQSSDFATFDWEAFENEYYPEKFKKAVNQRVY